MSRRGTTDDNILSAGIKLIGLYVILLELPSLPASILTLTNPGVAQGFEFVSVVLRLTLGVVFVFWSGGVRRLMDRPKDSPVQRTL